MGLYNYGDNIWTGFFLANRIASPIGHMRDEAEKVSLGDLDVEVSVDAQDEIGDLATTCVRPLGSYAKIVLPYSGFAPRADNCCIYAARIPLYSSY